MAREVGSQIYYFNTKSRHGDQNTLQYRRICQKLKLSEWLAQEKAVFEESKELGLDANKSEFVGCGVNGFSDELVLCDVNLQQGDSMQAAIKEANDRLGKKLFAADGTTELRKVVEEHLSWLQDPSMLQQVANRIQELKGNTSD